VPPACTSCDATGHTPHELRSHRVNHARRMHGEEITARSARPVCKPVAGNVPRKDSPISADPFCGEDRPSVLGFAEAMSPGA
jgi:hypothetical protein